jgi:large subunit ribosomal protein L4
MSTAQSVNLKGEAGERVSLPKEVFEAPASPSLLAQAVKIYLGNQRKSGAKTKTRGEVSRTTAKMYKQKGTGRARHGSYSAPIFVGGGVSHGPTGSQNWRRKLSSALTKRALLGALSLRLSEKRLEIITGGDKASGKTKDAEKALNRIGDLLSKTLVVVTTNQKRLARSYRNIDGVTVVERDRLNVYEVLLNKNLLLTEEAVEELKVYASNK